MHTPRFRTLSTVHLHHSSTTLPHLAKKARAAVSTVSMPVWYDESNVAHRLRHPLVYPGGPSVVAEPAAARRQSVQQFQDQATAAWAELLHNIQEGLQIQDHHNDGAPHQQDTDQMTLEPQQQQQQQDQPSTQHQQHQPSQVPLPPSQHQQQRQGAGLDLSGLAAPLLPRRRLTGPVQLVPVPDYLPPGPIPQQAAAAAVAAALAAQAPNQGPKEALAVPGGCLDLHSWKESSNAEDPPGMVATVHDVMPPPPAAAGGGWVRGGDDERYDEDDVMEPGSEVVVTFTVMDTSRLQQRQQEIQVLGSNTLAELRDAICCPTDKLAEGLGATNAAAYFYIDKSFYDDTRAAAAAECSQTVEQWAQRLGLSGPRHLLRHFELPEDTGHGVQQLQPPQRQELPAHAGGEGLQLQEEEEQQQGQQAEQQQQPGQRREMQHVRVRELVLQASNRPMVLYSHQGLCEHAVVVSDVRLLHAADPSRRSAYPRTVFKAVLGKRLSCGLCRRFGATALMLDHPETPEAVTVLCQLCCGLFSVERHPGAKLIMLEAF